MMTYKTTALTKVAGVILGDSRAELRAVDTRVLIGSLTAVGEKAQRIAPRLRRFRIWLGSVPNLSWLVGALLVATAARLAGLDQQSLWVDEGTTYIRAILPLNVALANLLEVRDQVPLYYLLLRISTPMFGSSEFALRYPSVCFGLVDVAFVYLLGRSSGREHVGILGAWMAALNPFHVWYSREARMYSLGILLVSIAMWLFLLALRYGGSRRWTALTIASAAAYLTHFATLGVGLVQLCVFVLTFRRTYRAFRGWVLSQAVAVTPTAGWLALSMISHGYSGIRGAWIPKPSVLAPAMTLWNFSILYDGRLTVLTALTLLVFAITLWSGLRLQGTSRWRRILTVWLALPPFLALVVSFALGPVYVDRYLSICVPAYLLLVSVGIAAFPVRRLRGGLCAFLLVTMAMSTLGIPGGKQVSKADWRQALGHVVEGAEEDDRVFVAGGLFVTHYYVGDTLPITRVDPRSPGSHLQAAVCQDGRVWFVYRDPTDSPHKLARTEPFDPYNRASSQIASFLVNHGDQIRREWSLKGVYLALLECSDGDGSIRDG